jgi:hypothetical protein
LRRQAHSGMSGFDRLASLGKKSRIAERSRE